MHVIHDFECDESTKFKKKTQTTHELKQKSKRNKTKQARIHPKKRTKKHQNIRLLMAWQLHMASILQIFSL